MQILSRFVPDVIRRSYALKFGIVLLVIALLVGTIGVVATTVVQSEVQQNADESQATLATQEANALQEWNEQNKQRVQTINEMPNIETINESDLRKFTLHDQADRYQGDANSLHVVNLNSGQIVASTAWDLSGEHISDTGLPDATNFLESADSDEVTVSDPYRSAIDGDEDQPVITYLDVTNGGDHALVYTVDITYYNDVLHSYDLDRTTTLVLDENGSVFIDDADFGAGNQLFGLPYGDVDGLEIPGTTQVDQPPSDSLLTQYYDFPDEEYVVATAEVEGTDWTVLVHTPTADAYGIVQSVFRWGIVATLGGVLLITSIGAVVGRNTAVATDELTTKAGQIEDGNLDVDFQTDRIDSIGRLYAAFDSMQGSLQAKIREVEAARERTERLNRHLERTADEYSDVMRAAGEGDFTARMEPDEKNEAMEEIALEFNGMLEDIETTVEQVQRFSGDVATASQQVTASSEEVRSASKQVTQSIQEISDGADRQNESLQSVTREMDDLSRTTEEIASSANQVADLADRSADASQQGQDAAQAAIEGMNEIETESERAVDAMGALGEEIERIDELTAFISEVAEQTNMLALNANIEAARSSADRQGGFGVVAEEVKELAAETKEAAEDIDERIEEIKSRTERTAAEVQNTSEEIARHRTTVEETVDALEEIALYVGETADGMQEISSATEQQAASTQEVVAMVDEAAAISDQTTTEAENVAAAAEEQTTALTEVTRSVSDLSKQARDLSSALDRFETDADVESVRSFESESESESEHEPPSEFDDAGVGAPPSDAEPTVEPQPSGETRETDSSVDDPDSWEMRSSDTETKRTFQFDEDGVEDADTPADDSER